MQFYAWNIHSIKLTLILSGMYLCYFFISNSKSSSIVAVDFHLISKQHFTSLKYPIFSEENLSLYEEIKFRVTNKIHCFVANSGNKFI